MKRFFMYGVIIFLTAQCNAKIYKQSLLNMILFSDLNQLEKTLTDEIEQIEKEINKIQQKFIKLFSNKKQYKKIKEEKKLSQINSPTKISYKIKIYQPFQYEDKEHLALQNKNSKPQAIKSINKPSKQTKNSNNIINNHTIDENKNHIKKQDQIISSQKSIQNTKISKPEKDLLIDIK